MASHNERGQLGEQLAVAYFLEKGYQILHTNWRWRRLEVDIIGSKKNMLHFIEVKYRATTHFGHPEESVSIKKIKNLVDASAEFLYQFPQWRRIQFDVLAISLQENGVHEYFLIEDVYL